MGRSRGGLTTKIHALVDAEGRPMRLELTPGQAHDGAMAAVFLPISSRVRSFWPIAPTTVTRSARRPKHAPFGPIFPKRNRKASISFSRWVYRQRNLVERFFNRIKQYRGIATRYDKCPLNFLAAVKLVSSLIWIRAKCVHT